MKPFFRHRFHGIGTRGQHLLGTSLFVAALSLSTCPVFARVFPKTLQASTQEVAGEPVPALDADVAAFADSTLQQTIEAHRPKEMEAELYARTLGKHGRLEPLLAFLDGRALDAEEAHWRTNAARLAGHMAWRHGDLEDALARFDALVRQ